ncbi:MAG: cytochrome b/b6 domain-containing protein [Planctomycetes bacterium]|nr:cytochrome b/b6 domain-containing protein [Planctomycetota bacterium]
MVDLGELEPQSQTCAPSGRSARPAVGVTFQEAAAEWRRPLTGIVLGLILFETLTGFAIYLLPFSVFNQFGVLLHTLAGVLMTVPVAWYLGRHWWRRCGGKFSHYQLLGYLAAAALLMVWVSGFVLTWQAALGTRISYLWDQVHLVTGAVLVFVLVVHTGMLWFRRVNAPEVVALLTSAKRRFLRHVTMVTLALVGLHVGVVLLYRSPEINNEFPSDYSWKFGKDRPFAPSLVRTVSNRAYDPTTLSGSAGCGTSGCHSEILKEWQPSAHRYASSDVVFQAVQRIMLEDVGAEATRYCAGCHDPIALLSGHKNVNVEGLTSVGADEGISCIVCHSIVQTDVRGNADYTVTQPERYVGETKEGRWNKWTSDFLIRAYPEHHKASFSRPLYKTAEFCAACHKQFIDEEVNQIGWVQLQNQYDNWRNSRWYHEGDAAKTITCRECHMPLVDSIDPASGDGGDYNRSPDDGKHRSHRTLGANQVIPVLMDLPGGEEQVKLTEAWLRGEIDVPEIADKWTAGPVIRLELLGPESVKPGEQVDVQIVVTNNKTGHGFPTGPLDIIRSWVEMTVTDENGNIVHELGKPDEQGVMTPETMVFKAEAIDRYGNDIDRHNLWEMVGARFKRSLFPGMSDSETYSFACPGLSAPPVPEVDQRTHDLDFAAPSGSGTLHVKAVLNYQKADAAFLDRLFGSEARVRTPITEMATAELSIRVER